MDPYLEHPILWTGVHSRLINVISQQLGPKLRPRYVASIEERVMIDVPQHQRVPDVWVQKASNSDRSSDASAVLEEPLIMEIASDPIRENYIEILDRYQDLRVVTIIEVLSPINKQPGPGRENFLCKRNATLHSSTHLVEIDLLRHGERVVEFTPSQLDALGPFDYLVSIHRNGTQRTRYEIFARRLRDRLPTFGIPLWAPDPDVPLDLQAALEQVYEDASYMLRVRYERPCIPPLTDEDQAWASRLWTEYQTEHRELFG
jgi:hypothetical protein